MSIEIENLSPGLDVEEVEKARAIQRGQEALDLHDENWARVSENPEASRNE